MPIRVVEIHHQGIRINGDEAGLAANLDFYQGILGLIPDSGRPAFPGIPGFWMNVGETGQLHLIGGDQPSHLRKARTKTPHCRMSRWRLPMSPRQKPNLIAGARPTGRCPA
jgi:catechol 2,3-dioxygenase-like lactoylglutathione lyase family enzyme